MLMASVHFNASFQPTSENYNFFSIDLTLIVRDKKIIFIKIRFLSVETHLVFFFHYPDIARLIMARLGRLVNNDEQCWQCRYLNPNEHTAQTGATRLRTF